MRVEDIKINPKLLKPLMETLDLLFEEKRVEYVDSLLADVEQTIQEAQHYAKSKNLDYETALRHMIIARDPNCIYKDGC